MRKTNTSALHFINEVAGNSRLYIIFLLLVQMVLGISSVFYALLLRGLIDGAVAHDSKKMLTFCVLFATLVVGQIALRAVLRFLEEYAKATYENAFKSRLFAGFVAFTGPSGCGKSTVLKLLMGLYTVDAGEVYGCRRNMFAYVPQGNQLMSGSIRDIITFSDKNRTGDEAGIHRALQIACADGFIAELEQGIDTLLGERGLGLSEGQMQRLAIARAIYSDRPVLLLDEATSALDAGTEEAVLGNLRSMTDKTVIIVTHRPAALKLCDRQVAFGEKDGKN